MSYDNQNPDLEQETQTEETTEETSNENESEESKDVDEVEEMKKELAKYKRLVKKFSNSEEEKPTTSSNETEQLRKELDVIRLEQRGYSKETIDQIMELGGPQVLENPLIKKAVEGAETQSRAEQGASVRGSSQSAIRSKISPEELRTMSSKEMEKHLPKS